MATTTVVAVEASSGKSSVSRVGPTLGGSVGKSDGRGVGRCVGWCEGGGRDVGTGEGIHRVPVRQSAGSSVLPSSQSCHAPSCFIASLVSEVPARPSVLVGE